MNLLRFLPLFSFHMLAGNLDRARLTWISLPFGGHPHRQPPLVQRAPLFVPLQGLDLGEAFALHLTPGPCFRLS